MNKRTGRNEDKLGLRTVGIAGLFGPERSRVQRGNVKSQKVRKGTNRLQRGNVRSRNRERRCRNEGHAKEFHRNEGTNGIRTSTAYVLAKAATLSFRFPKRSKQTETFPRNLQRRNEERMRVRTWNDRSTSHEDLVRSPARKALNRGGIVLEEHVRSERLNDESRTRPSYVGTWNECYPS